MVERHTAINEKYGIDHDRGIERNIGISRWMKGNVNIAEEKTWESWLKMSVERTAFGLLISIEND
jgi:hypothetical protein